MIPNPIHPAIVHFPIVFAVLLPLAAIVALLLVMRGAHFRRTWLLPAALAVALAAVSFAAVRSGEAQEDRVEDVIGERPLHQHEEAAERFLLLTAIVAGVSLIGLAGGNVGVAARWMATAGAVVILAAGYQVGRSGGELVYEHGAASAYVGERVAATPDGSAAVDRDEEGDEELD